MSVSYSSGDGYFHQLFSYGRGFFIDVLEGFCNGGLCVLYQVEHWAIIDELDQGLVTYHLYEDYDFRFDDFIACFQSFWIITRSFGSN